MKDLVAGMGAGVVVGVVGLAVGLTLVPVWDHEAISGADNPATAETPLFADEPEAAPVWQDDAGEIMAPTGDVPAAPAADEGTRTRPASEVMRAPEAAVAPPLGEAAPEIPAAEPAAALPAAEVRAPEPGLDAQAPKRPGEAATGTAEAPPTLEDPPAADPAPDVTPPAAQILAPRAPASVPAPSGGPGLTLDPASGHPRDGTVPQPAALVVPEGGVAPPDFDGEVPSAPEPQPRSDGEAAATQEAEDDRPALIRNAIAEPPWWDVPLLAIVVMDRAGTDPIEGAPLSVAIAADAEDAHARVEAWRAAGAEIVAIPGPPLGAAGSEPLAAFEALPQAATVMVGSTQGLAGGPVAADAIAAALAETGHGLILHGGTFTSVAQAAERAGVPTVEIFRQVDGGDRDGRAVGRFLDQAAFEARNRGAVVVIADNSPETAEGLERFLAGSRADSVTLVPVSAVLRRK